ncbi:activating signal cointegrator 1 [Babesia ovis]|uniref:Activating signal cointegrator 1 n=1 Tax=Babesia ovis TaxID=5869 RepID=A0A9W5WTL3_BABOV|nr:activating signal cointegrator 1 [Babesia ovis]
MGGGDTGYIVYRKKKLVDDGAYSVTAKPTKNKADKTNINKAKVAPKEESKRERIKCGCGGHQHECFSNCMGCGRIVCANEGEGPCFHCGALVFSVENLDGVPKEHADHPEFQSALELRDRLLIQDATYANQTMKVHDLHTDWFREANSVYNENTAYARMQYYKEEAEKRAEAGKQPFNRCFSKSFISDTSSRH